MKTLQWSLWVVGLALQWLLLTALVHTGWRKFPALFVYATCLLITTLGDITAYVLLGPRHPSYATYYWTAELIRQSGLFGLVVSMVVGVLPHSRSRRTFIGLIIIAAAIFWIGSLALHHDSKLNVWMTQVIRNLSFCSAILDLILWFVLISNVERDTARLMIAGGLGLQMTGDAVGQSIRQLKIGKVTFMAGNMVIVLAHFLCLFIWWQAVSRRAREHERRSTLIQAFDATRLE